MTYHQTCEHIATCIMERQPSIIIYQGGVAHNLSLPAPQRSGTYTQQQTYALLKAREIANTIKTPTT